MPDELAELLDTAMYTEIVSQAFYIARQSKTQGSSAKALMKEPLPQRIHPTVNRIITEEKSHLR